MKTLLLKDICKSTQHFLEDKGFVFYEVSFLFPETQMTEMIQWLGQDSESYWRVDTEQWRWFADTPEWQTLWKIDSNLYARPSPDI